LSNPQPLSLEETQSLLTDDEAVIVIQLDETRSYVWAITRERAEWRELPVKAAAVSETVKELRSGLDPHSDKKFDPALSFALYRQLLTPVAEMIASKPRLSMVFNGALTSLPPQVLVTADPTGKTLREVDWLISRHAVTVLPSLASLKVLRDPKVERSAPRPLIGFADPVFDPTLPRPAPQLASLPMTKGLGVANTLNMMTALDPLPQTADELRKVAASVGARASDIFLGPQATETRVKQTKLDDYRIVYFATHGLLAADVARLAKLNAEPALVLSLPEHPTEFDDGVLTASEIAQLKLNAEWVVLSACDTAAGGQPSAEPLSGLASAFFYAGGRSLVVSHWEAEVKSSIQLMTGTFGALAANPHLSHGQALQQAMLAVIADASGPDWSEPKYWAPFVVVGEPAKPRD
jgi:CHAT domain-containing protein